MEQTEPTPGMDRPAAAGLCARCRHVRVIRSDRGSLFYQCLLSFTDPRFSKYPRLPVRDCPGFAQAGKDA